MTRDVTTLARWIREGLAYSYGDGEDRKAIYDSILGVALVGKCGSSVAAAAAAGSLDRDALFHALEISEDLATRAERVFSYHDSSVSLVIAALEGTLMS